MITFEYRFDVLPGKLRDYERYTKGAGKDIWLRFKGVRGVRVYKSMLGGRLRRGWSRSTSRSRRAREDLTDPAFRK